MKIFDLIALGSGPGGAVTFAVIQTIRRRRVLAVPHNPGDDPLSQRHGDKVAGHKAAPFRNQIIESLLKPQRQQYRHPVFDLLSEQFSGH